MRIYFPWGSLERMSYKYYSTITNKNLSTPEILKQVCRPVLCVSSCRMKCSRMLAIYLLVINVFYLLPFNCHTFLLFQHLSVGQCLTYLWVLLPFLFLGFKYGFDFQYLEQGGGLQVYKMTIFPTADLGTVLLWSNLLEGDWIILQYVGVGVIISASTDPESEVCWITSLHKIHVQGPKDK